MATGFSSLLLNTAPRILGFFQQRSAVNARNRERLKQNERNKSKYINDFNRDVVKWQNDQINEDISVDEKWQQVQTKIASDDLKLWSAISRAGIETQIAYAALMSVGASEQTGRRSATTIDRRKAVLQYAARMNQVANNVSFGNDAARLNRTSWANEFTRFAQQSHVKKIEGRPMPGLPPPSIPLEAQPDFLTGLVLPIAGEFLDYKQLQSELNPPYTDEEMRGNNPPPSSPPPQQSTSIPINNSQYWGMPTGRQQLQSFFTTRSRNQASNQLGSQFLIPSQNWLK